MIKVTCLCGKVRVRTAKRPDYIHDCNCTLCSKSGARWGYFDPSDVTVQGDSTGYSRADKDDPAAEIHFCATCGATTHFILTPSAVARFGNSMMGVNMWLADATALAGLELRFPDGKAWPGEGDFTYVRVARILA